MKQNKQSKTIIIPELKIEVEKELRPRVKFKDIIIPKGWRLMTFQEGCYIFDNVPEIELSKDYEWIKHYSKRMEKSGYVSALYRGWLVDDRLYVDGNGDGNYRNGYAFGVRFVRDIKVEK